MSPQLMIPAAALFWIDRLESDYPASVARVVRKLLLRCVAEGSARIEMTATDLAAATGISLDAIRLTARVMSSALKVSRTPNGWAWSFPPEVLPSTQQSLPLEAVEITTPGSQEWLFPPSSTPGYLDHNSAISSPKTPGVQESYACNPRSRWGDLLGTEETWAQRSPWAQAPTKNQQHPMVPALVVQGTRSAPSNSNRSTSEFSNHRSYVLGRIGAAHAVENHQRQDAVELRTALHSYMSQYGDSIDHDTNPPDEEILARCFAIAPLGELLQHLTVMRKTDVRGMQKYAWFVTRFADKLRNINRKELNAALSKEKRSHRQTHKPTNPNPSHESAPSAQTQTQNREFRDDILHQVAGAGRRMP